MPQISNIEEAKECARALLSNPTCETILVDSEGSIFINRDPKSLEGKFFQVKPEIKEEPVKQKKVKPNE